VDTKVTMSDDTTKIIAEEGRTDNEIMQGEEIKSFDIDKNQAPFDSLNANEVFTDVTGTVFRFVSEYIKIITENGGEISVSNSQKVFVFNVNSQQYEFVISGLVDSTKHELVDESQNSVSISSVETVIQDTDLVSISVENEILIANGFIVPNNKIQ